MLVMMLLAKCVIEGFKYQLPKGTKFNKLSYNILLCDTLTVDLPSITDLAFNGFRDFTCEADFTITITVQIIRCKVMIANSGKTIIHNTVQLFIVLQGQLLGEFDAVVEVVNVVHKSEKFEEKVLTKLRDLGAFHSAHCSQASEMQRKHRQEFQNQTQWQLRT